MPTPQNQIDWRTIIRRIKSGKFTPIISYRVGSQHILSTPQTVAAWADEIDYPLQDRTNLTRVAQFKAVTSRDALSAKEEYLEFLKIRLLELSRKDLPADQQAFLDTLEAELYDISLSEVANRLGYPHYNDELDNPLRILAELPLPIYITTNYANFMEDALKAAGKSPRTEVCYWHDELRDDRESVFEADSDYQPSEAEPLVFHVHGVDDIASSLVLTEDDYLDFLVKVAEDPEVVPRRVSQALADSSLLLLGYRLQEWDFRVLFRGLIKSKRASRRLLSLSIQLLPESDDPDDAHEVQEYLTDYFGKANFDIYWGDAAGFADELWSQWEA